MVEDFSIIAGLPRAQSARGTEPHTHKLWSTSFPMVVTWLTERTYASTDCTGGVRETIKRKGGVSQARLAKSTSLHCTFTIWSIDSCQNRIATDQYPITKSWAHVSTHWGDVIYLEAARWPVYYFTRSRSMFSPGGGHDLAKFRVPMIHRFMTSHPVAELLPCFRANHKDGRPVLFGFLVIFTHRLTVG